jgi:hypothetical protein
MQIVTYHVTTQTKQDTTRKGLDKQQAEFSWLFLLSLDMLDTDSVFNVRLSVLISTESWDTKAIIIIIIIIIIVVVVVVVVIMSCLVFMYSMRKLRHVRCQIHFV